MSIKHDGGDETEGRVRLDWSFGFVWFAIVRACDSREGKLKGPDELRLWWVV